MQKLKDFVERVDIVRWLRFRNILNVFLNVLDSIMRLSIGQSVLILLILIVREAYFRNAVSVEEITGAIYLVYAMSVLVSAMIAVLIKSQEIRTVILSITKMSLSLIVIGLTTSNVRSLEDCTNLVISFLFVWILSKLLIRTVLILDDLIQRSLYDFSRILDDLSLIEESDILNLDRTDKVVEIVEQTRLAKIENQDLATEEIFYHLALVVKDYHGKSHDLKSIVYSCKYNEITLID